MSEVWREVAQDHPPDSVCGIWRRQRPSGKQRCARCHRPFTPKTEGQRYGEKCAKKMQDTHIEVRNMKGEVLAAIV